MPDGKIIFLDGSTSAGKTTLARCLQSLIDEPYWHLPIDGFTAMLPAEALAQRQAITTAQFLSGYNHCIVALAKLGYNIIVDTGLLEPGWLAECVELFSPFNVIFVAVSCPLEELELREQRRGDRQVGYARSMIERIHQNGLYDLVVDTSVHSPSECAVLIKSALEHPALPSAFEQMLLTMRQDGPDASGHLFGRVAEV